MFKSCVSLIHFETDIISDGRRHETFVKSWEIDEVTENESVGIQQALLSHLDAALFFTSQSADMCEAVEFLR